MSWDKCAEWSDALLAGYDNSLQASGEGFVECRIDSSVTDEPEPAMDDDANRLDTDALSETEENKFEVHATNAEGRQRTGGCESVSFRGSPWAGWEVAELRHDAGGDDKDAWGGSSWPTRGISRIPWCPMLNPESVQVFKLENSDPGSSGPRKWPKTAT